jgi:hypothetical protein
VATAPAIHRDQRSSHQYSRGLILVNPRSFRMSLRGRLDRVKQLAAERGLPIVLASEPREIEPHLQAALDAHAPMLTLLGGDGTLQATVTSLAENHTVEPDAELPRLLMLGGGRTNYTARDLGTHRHLIDTLQLALDQPDQLKETVRHSLLVEQNGTRQHGFFIAGALVDHVIRDCHHYRASGRGPLRTGHLSSAWRLLQLAARAALGRGDFNVPLLDIDAGELGQMNRTVRLLLVTSLHHRSEWVDPYADRGQGEIRLSAIASDAERFWLGLPRLVTGRYGDKLDLAQGYLSGRTREVRIDGLTSISLDGQEHDYDPSRPVWIRTGPALRFVHR